MKKRCVSLFGDRKIIVFLNFLLYVPLFAGLGDLEGLLGAFGYPAPWPLADVTWCPNGNCDRLAAIGSAGDLLRPEQVYVYERDVGTGLFSFDFRQVLDSQVQFYSADWCGQNCEYFATGGSQEAPVIIWNFTGTVFDQPVYPVSSLGQTEIRSVAWACVGNSCQYLAAGGGGEYSLMVLERLETETYSIIVAEPSSRSNGIFSVAWCCDGSDNYLATGGLGDSDCSANNTVNIYEFVPGNPTLSVIATASTAGIVRSVAWCGDESSPCTYLAAGGYGRGEIDAKNGISAITIFSFNGNRLVPITTQDNPSIVASVAWCSGGGCRGDDTTCKYLFVTGLDQRLTAYRFDGKALCYVTHRDIGFSGISMKLCGDDCDYIAIGTYDSPFEYFANYLQILRPIWEPCMYDPPIIPPSEVNPPKPPLPPCC